MAASKTREARIIKAVACPECHAAAGERCKNPIPHQAYRGPEDRRKQPTGTHNVRRVAWIEWKQSKGII